MTDNPGPQPPSNQHINAFTRCGNELEFLSSEDRGRVLRALVELYRKDFEQRQTAQQVLGQLVGGYDPKNPLGPKYGDPLTSRTG